MRIPMALLVLILVGAMIGWLASILARTEAPRKIVSQIGLALIASLAAGVIANNFYLMGGISLFALAMASAAALVALVAYHALLRPLTDET